MVTRGNPLKMAQICTFKIQSNMNNNTSDIAKKKVMC